MQRWHYGYHLKKYLYSTGASPASFGSVISSIALHEVQEDNLSG